MTSDRPKLVFCATCDGKGRIDRGNPCSICDGAGAFRRLQFSLRVLTIQDGSKRTHGRVAVLFVLRIDVKESLALVYGFTDRNEPVVVAVGMVHLALAPLMAFDELGKWY